MANAVFYGSDQSISTSTSRSVFTDIRPGRELINSDEHSICCEKTKEVAACICIPSSAKGCIIRSGTVLSIILATGITLSAVGHSQNNSEMEAAGNWIAMALAVGCLGSGLLVGICFGACWCVSNIQNLHGTHQEAARSLRAANEMFARRFIYPR